MFENDAKSSNCRMYALDPRIKIAGVAAFSFLIAMCSRWSALLPALLFSVLFVLFSRLSPKKVCLRLVLVNGLIAFLWLFVPFSIEGKPLFHVVSFTATEEGVLFSTLLTLRSNIILLCLICLVSTTSIFSLGSAMGQLQIPGKMIQLFFFTFRYVHVIEMEYRRMVNALKIRAFQPKTSLHTYRTYAYLVGMLLVRSYDRSERVRNAMICRGFRGRFYDLSEFSLKPFDFLTICVFFLILVLIVLLEWTKLIY